MDTILQFLSELLPAGVFAIALGFSYLVYLFKRVSGRFIDIADKQAEYLKDRFDVVDKSTSIFSRTIDQQEREIEKLARETERLSSELETTRRVTADRAIEELQLLAGTIQRLAQEQDALRQHVIQTQTTHSAIPPFAHRSEELTQDFGEGVDRAIHLRDLSIYTVSVAPLPDASELRSELSVAGFAVVEQSDVFSEVTPDESQAIWLGHRFPPSAAVEAIRIARRRWPFLRYVDVPTGSVPDHVHSSLYFGGSTKTAQIQGLYQWSDEDFARLSPEMDFAEFHKYVRQRIDGQERRQTSVETLCSQSNKRMQATEAAPCFQPRGRSCVSALGA